MAYRKMTLRCLVPLSTKKFPFQNNLPFIHINLFLNDTSVYSKVKVGIYEEPQEYTQIQITNIKNQYHSFRLVPEVELSSHL